MLTSSLEAEVRRRAELPNGSKRVNEDAAGEARDKPIAKKTKKTSPEREVRNASHNSELSSQSRQGTLDDIVDDD